MKSFGKVSSTITMTPGRWIKRAPVILMALQRAWPQVAINRNMSFLTRPSPAISSKWETYKDISSNKRFPYRSHNLLLLDALDTFTTWTAMCKRAQCLADLWPLNPIDWRFLLSNAHYVCHLTLTYYTNMLIRSPCHQPVTNFSSLVDWYKS